MIRSASRRVGICSDVDDLRNKWVGILRNFSEFGLACSGVMTTELARKSRKQSEPHLIPMLHGTEVRFTAACWMVSVQARSASASIRSLARGVDGGLGAAALRGASLGPADGPHLPALSSSAEELIAAVGLEP